MFDLIMVNPQLALAFIYIGRGRGTRIVLQNDSQQKP